MNYIEEMLERFEEHLWQADALEDEDKVCMKLCMEEYARACAGSGRVSHCSKE